MGCLFNAFHFMSSKKKKKSCSVAIFLHYVLQGNIAALCVTQNQIVLTNKNSEYLWAKTQYSFT